MIISMDLMTELGIYVDTATKNVRWDDHSIPLKVRGELSKHQNLQDAYNLIQSVPVLQQADTQES